VNSESGGRFANSDALIDQVFSVINIVGSTSKDSGSQAEWLTTFEWFYQAIEEVVAESGDAGHVVKFVGDGVLLAYQPSHAHAAINDAIRLLEKLKLQRQHSLVRFEVSIGITYGEVRTWPHRDGSVDYLGSAVDRAFRLSSVAAGNALLVDSPTCSAANTFAVKSQVGRATSRTPDEYLGDRRETELKGFAKTTKYHEILWDDVRHGLAEGNQAKDTSFVRGRWPADRVQAAIRSAPDGTEVWILQTWFPDHEEFMAFLERELEEKLLKLRILLINPDKPEEGEPDVLAGRIAMRDETRDYAAIHVHAAVASLKSIKKRVDRIHRDRGHELDLQIRFYSFAPFGPIFGIGRRELYAGVFLCDRSSATAFGVEMTDETSREWSVVRSHFETAWEASRVVFPEI
jgi:class 3 adenylate cyclase